MSLLKHEPKKVEEKGDASYFVFRVEDVEEHLGYKVKGMLSYYATAIDKGRNESGKSPFECRVAEVVST